jgi:hypothetical protein
MMTARRFGLVCHSDSDVLLLRSWLSRCIRGMAQLPPTKERNQTLRTLQGHLDDLPRSNVVPMRGRL